MDYKSTLNLPKTDFPMKAGLAEQEPARLEKWQKEDLYRRVLAKRDPQNKYVLHDGPPYANGDIHTGTALNKILKDIIVKIKSGSGFYSPYVPGWDCHGLPIEHKVDKELGAKKASMSKNEIRRMCRDYAGRWLDIQRSSFKRLGVLGDWDNPYITMDFKYETATLRELYSLYKKGYVYKGSKPVYWCSDCVTALAEAEVEYADHTSHSLFVKFPLTDSAKTKLGFDKKDSVSAVIWTTTPWTLPANMAISMHPKNEYSAMKINEDSNNLKKGEILILGKPLVEHNGLEGKPLKEKLGVGDWQEMKTFEGADFERLEAKHPFYDRTSLLILGDHVLMTDGTGLVHTAPAHGLDDYVVGNRYNIEVYNPVDDFGKFKQDLPLFGGMYIKKANEQILAHMRENGTLIADGKISHSYPHCWRCKQPVIFRSTPQWFISMDHKLPGESMTFKEKALHEIRNVVKFTPAWGANRIGSMVENRPDWCISRQRAWGVPIALFSCTQCEKIVFDEKIEKKVLDSFGEKGADAWFEYDVEYYLGKNCKCPECGSTSIRKETDILDVWFDSGVSHAAVCEARPELGRADMYLEGSDQHRGWFQSSLLQSVASRGKAPYKEILTHGFVMDKMKKKMSKSLGNIISAEEIVSKFGAEIMRLWVASEDYSNDISISDEILKRQVDTYRKIRNTMRYLLGNLYDFDPTKDSVPFEKMMELDRFTLIRWEETLKKIYAGYDEYQLHVFYHSFINFCTNDLSAFYLDILKDRLYSFAPASAERRSAQTVLFTLAKEMAVVMAPILSFSADEVWDYLPSWEGKSKFVFEEFFPKCDRYKDSALVTKMTKLSDMRKIINKALELARADKIIGHPLDAKVIVGVKKETPLIDEGFSRFLIVSEVVLAPFDTVKGYEDGDIVVSVEAANNQKCERCWTKDKTVGKNPETLELCDRCATVVKEMA